MVDDEELLELVELEVCELFSDYDFFGDDIFIVVGFVFKAIEGEKEYKDVIFEFMKVVDDYIDIFEWEVDKFFLMVVEDVFFIIGCGIVVIGWIECGKVKVGEEIFIVGIKDICKVIVIGVEMF